MTPLVIKSFVPPVFLISLIKGSILFGFATSEAGAVGAFGATLLDVQQKAFLGNSCFCRHLRQNSIYDLFIVISHMFCLCL